MEIEKKIKEKEGFWIWFIGIFFLVVMYWALWVYGHPIIAISAAVLTLYVYFKFLYQPEEVYKRESIPSWMKDEVLKKQNYHCKYCEQKYPLQFHHIQPVAKGGLTNIENLEVLCTNHHDSITRVK